MDTIQTSWSLIGVIGVMPMLAYVVWNWNDIRFTTRAFLRRVRLPPGHMGLPFLGETLNLLWYFKVVSRPDDFITTKQERYGEELGMYRSHLFGQPTIITCSPASNKFVLQNEENFKIHWPALELVGFTASADGKHHTWMRSFVLRAVNQPEALRRSMEAVQPQVVAAMQSWAQEGTINSYLAIKKVTFDNICKMFTSMDPSPVTEIIQQSLLGVISGFRAYPLDLPGTTLHHALRCRRKVVAIFREELEKRKMRKHDGSNDLMDGLMQMKDENGKQLSDNEILDNIISLIIGGYKSTALASMWAMVNISRTPEVLHKLREENLEIRKRKKTDFITLDDISQLKYTAKVVEEVIRTANLSSFIPRIAQRDVEYKGHTIPKGWQVLVCLRCLHTDAKYFENPLSFNPERWNERAKPGTFQVFGVGPRLCAGNMLARMQLTIFLHHLSTGYNWELINPEAKVTYLPHPMPVDGGVIKIRAL